MKKLLTPFLILPCLCALAKAEQADSLFVRSIDNIVVTATRTPLPLKDAPVITRVINAVDIERSGAYSLRNLMETELAGVEFHQAGYGVSMSFQGLDARYVLVLVDGERMAGETYGNVDLGRIPLSSVERIEIVRGASSVLYGSNAMGAVVNVITRMPKNKVEVKGSARYGTRYQKNSGEAVGDDWSARDEKKYHDKLDLPNTSGDVSVGFNFGNFRSLTSATCQTADAYKLVGTKSERRHYAELIKMRPDISYVGGVPTLKMTEVNGVSIPVFIEASRVADTTIYAEPDRRGLGVGGAWEMNLNQRFEYEPSDMFRISVTGGYFKKKRYDFLTSMSDENPVSAYTSGNKKWAYQTFEGHNIKAMVEHTPTDRSKVYISYLYDMMRRGQDSLSGVSVKKQRHSYNSPRVQWTLRLDDHRITSGIEYLNERLKFDLSENGYGDTYDMNTVSLFVQDEIMSGKRLSFIAGIRVDYNDKFDWNVTPTVSAKFDVDNFIFRANYSNGYRLPSLKEMYMVFDVPTGDRILGNEDLKRERNHYASFSGEYNNSWLNVSATVGHSWFRNKIDVLRDGTTLRYGNIGKSRYGSLELVARARVATGLFLRADYNYIFSHSSGSSEATQYIFPSPHTAVLSLDYSTSLNKCVFVFNGAVRYVGAKKYDDMMPYINLPDEFADIIAGGTIDMSQIGAIMRNAKYFTGAYSSRHDGYAVCRASVSVLPVKWFGVTVGVDNIFNHKPGVVNFNNAMMPGRNAYLKLSFDF